jgi:hypothetical protein
MNRFNNGYLTGRQYFNVSDKDALIKELEHSCFNNVFNSLVERLKRGENWEEVGDYAVCYIAEGCGVNG